MGLARLMNWLVVAATRSPMFDDLSGGELRDMVVLHVVGAEALDIDMARPID